MTTKENARPTFGAAGRAVENGSVCETAQPSTTDFNTAPAERQPLQISDLLAPGQQNARPLRYLKELTGYTGREVRRMIQRERLSGIPILSNCVGGYYLPGDSAERERCVCSLRRRAKEIEMTADAIAEAEV